MTKREQGVLALLKQSMSNKHIALALNISVLRFAVKGRRLGSRCWSWCWMRWCAASEFRGPVGASLLVKNTRAPEGFS
ncbi:LuxR C-terminal-related transcriptional regulator [Pseudomonas lini]|uniref:LuxR C-terminal-related transcriptional regulator n=1 Tax=Pseudomonas lini TaxID=163011 RepID=UPI0035945B73